MVLKTSQLYRTPKHTDLLDVFMDFETRALKEFDIKKVGGEKYTRNLDRVLCLAYRIGEDSNTTIWRHGDPPPKDLFEVIRERKCRINAFNATFEEAVWRNHCVPKLGWPPVPNNMWHCSAARSRALALPGSLGQTGAALGCKVTKDDEGRRIMLQVSQPRKPSKNNPSIWWEDEERLNKTYAYCINDVDSEVDIWRATFPLIPIERQIWLLDQKINRRGVMLDRDLISGALTVWEDHCDVLNAELEGITGGAAQKYSQVTRILDWMATHGVKSDVLDKAAVAELLKTELPAPVRRVLEIRSELSLSSIAKFKRAEQTLCEDDRVRGVHLYCGASQTGRWAGRLLQMQNIPRGVISYKNDDDYWERVEDYIAQVKRNKLEVHPDQEGATKGDILSSLLRPMIKAAPGKKLIVCDFSKVELCGNAWVCDQENLLEQRRQGEDPYKHMAAAIFNEDVADIQKGTYQYQLGKAASLGCGYSMGWKTFFNTCTNWGMPVTEEEAQLAVTTFRELYDKIALNWRQTEWTAIAAIRRPGTIQKCPNGKISYLKKGKWLYCILPSGRRLAYRNARIELRQTSWGEKKDTIVFEGMNFVGKWVTQTTYGGKLVENYIQASCRCLLAHSMLLLDLLGGDIIFHVHDEAALEVDENSFWDVPYVEKVMSVVPKWAEGFPLAAEGFEAYRYKK